MDDETVAGAETQADRPPAEGLPASVVEEHPREPATGLRLGNYELRAEVGRGSRGVVFGALLLPTAKFVALKLIRDPTLASYSDLRLFSEYRRFWHEAKALPAHPNIVPIYDVGFVGDHRFISMMLISGGNLTAHVTRLKDGT